jgi:hypothetical protein
LRIIYALWLLASVLFLCLPTVGSLAQSKDPGLQLTTRVLEQRYCTDANSEDQFSVKMQLELQYKNTGKAPIIFEKNSDVILGYKSSGNLNALQSLPFQEFAEARRHSAIATTGDKPSSDFVTLRPNQTYLVEAYFRLPYSNEWALKENQILQIVVGVWSGTKKQSEELKEKWKSTGQLWTDDIRSQPMQFSIEQDPQIEECSETTK